jgi:folate-binding protein YgfZ
MKDAADAAEKGALLVVEAERGTLVASGPDRRSWLNGIITCDAESVTPGSGALGLALTKTGKILSELWLVADADRVFVSTVPGKSASLHDHFDRMLVMEDAEIHDLSADYRWIALHGPRAKEWAERWAAEHAGAFGSIDWTGLGGAALVVPEAKLDAILTSIGDGSGAVRRASDVEWEALRIQRGYPRFGVDYDTDDNPHEATLDQRAVSWTKGCYLGQEVVCMQGMRGRVKRHLAALAIDTEVVPKPGAPVVREDGSEAGNVTSAAPSRTRGVVAFARLSGAALDASVVLSVAGARARIVEQAEPA